MMFILLSFLALACGEKNYVAKMERCKVSKVVTYQRYGGLLNEKSFTITTSNGYVFSSHVCPKVGDSIDVEVRYYNKKDQEKE